MTKAEIIDYLYEIHAHADIKIEDIADDLAVPVVHGRWIRVYSRPGVFKYLGWTCDQCGQRTGNEYAPQWYKFCPNCGARMDGKDGEHAEGTIQKERS